MQHSHNHRRAHYTSSMLIAVHVRNGRVGSCRERTLYPELRYVSGLKAHLVIEAVPQEARKDEEWRRADRKGLAQPSANPQDGLRLDVTGILLHQHNG